MGYSLDININHILAGEYFRNRSIPDDLIQAARILIDLKDLYQPIDQLIKKAPVLAGDAELSIENYEKYKAQKIKELRQDKWIQLALIEDLDNLNEDTAELKKLKKQAKTNAKNNPNYRINGIKINHGFHFWIDYTLKPEELTEPLFDIFFAYKLRQVDLQEIYAFLNYQSVKNFANDKEKFRRYLKIIFRKYEKVIPEHSVITASEWIERKEKDILGMTDDENHIESTNPIFKPETIQQIFDSLKDNFHQKQQVEFRQVLNTGNIPKFKLLFLGNGNKLATAFRELFNAQIITGCQQKNLEQWILSSFKYSHRGKQKEFTTTYLHKYISGNKTHCKSPIIEISPTDKGFVISQIKRKIKQIE